MMIFSNPLFYGIAACLAYGAAVPVMKKATSVGLSGNALLFFYGIGALLVFTVNVIRGQAVMYGGFTGVVWGLVMGLLFGAAFNLFLTGIGLLNGGLITGIVALTALYPLVGAGLEIGFMEIPQGINLKLIIPGVVLAVVGAIMVSAGMGSGQ